MRTRLSTRLSTLLWLGLAAAILAAASWLLFGRPARQSTPALSPLLHPLAHDTDPRFRGRLVLPAAAATCSATALTTPRR
jgi:hypothetical protein